VAGTEITIGCIISPDRGVFLLRAGYIVLQPRLNPEFRGTMAALRTAARKISQKTANDVVILAAVRTPVTRAFKGGFRDAFPEDILGPVGKLRTLRPAIF
jgi:hypothetical protein